MKYVWMIKDTRNGYSVGIFSTEEKANEVFEQLQHKMNYIIFKFELDRVYET